MQDIIKLFPSHVEKLSNFNYVKMQVSKTYSKTWSFREEGLNEMMEVMRALDSARPKEEAKSMMRAAIFILVRSLKDKVFAVSSFF